MNFLKSWIGLSAESEVAVKGKKGGVEKASCSGMLCPAKGHTKTIFLPLVFSTLLAGGQT